MKMPCTSSSGGQMSWEQMTAVPLAFLSPLPCLPFVLRVGLFQAKPSFLHELTPPSSAHKVIRFDLISTGYLLTSAGVAHACCTLAHREDVTHGAIFSGFMCAPNWPMAATIWTCFWSCIVLFLYARFCYLITSNVQAFELC